VSRLLLGAALLVWIPTAAMALAALLVIAYDLLDVLDARHPRRVVWWAPAVVLSLVVLLMGDPSDPEWVALTAALAVCVYAGGVFGGRLGLRYRARRHRGVS
jgi:hypothetical protein